MTVTAETEAPTEEGKKKRRGGPRGERKWRDKPTSRERVMTQSLSGFIKKETDCDISPETIRAVRFCLTKWSTSAETKSLRENIDTKLKKAKLQDKRERALAMIKEAESELSKLDDSDEDDEDEDEDEEDDDNELEDDDEEDVDDDEDAFA